MLEMDTFWSRIQMLAGFQEQKTPEEWTEEQKQQICEHMKDYWRQRKLQTKKK